MTRTGRRSARASEDVVRRALVRFVASAVAAVVILSVITLLVAAQIARHRALEDSRRQAANLANRLAAPMIDESIRRGDPGAAETLDMVMANRMRDGSVLRVKVWDAEGRVVWADSKVLVGRVFDLDPEVAALFGTRDTYAEVSSLEQAENVVERAQGELLEVYVGTFDSDGEPIVVETYLSTREMTDYSLAIATSFVTLVLGTLVVFLLVVLPLAYSLARRVQKVQAERTALMQHALRAADLERRRIAHDLHDGVIQDLSGVGYLLPTASKELHDGGDLDRATALVGRAAEVVQGDVAALRALMMDIYPPNLDEVGLSQALRELVALEASSAGIVGDVVAQPLELPTDTARLVYRVAREAVRNVVKHAHAATVTVEVQVVDSDVEVRVRDDGIGPGGDPGAAAKGHMGLRLVADTVRDFTGTFELRGHPDGGTVVEARFPVELVPG